MAARRRGEDIIDMSMGNPDGATPSTSSTSWWKRPPARPRTATRCPRASRACARPSVTGTSAATRSSWIRIPGHRHHRLQGRPGPPDAGHAGPWRHRAGAQSQLPHPHLRRSHRRRQHPFGAHDAGRGFLRGTGARRARVHSQAQDDGAGLSQQPPRSAWTCRSSSAWWRWPRNTTSWSCMTWPTPTSPSTATWRRPSCRCPARAMSPSSSSR